MILTQHEQDRVKEILQKKEKPIQFDYTFF